MKTDPQMEAWLKKQGVKSLEEAKGDVVRADAEFIEPDSEMADVLKVEIKGDGVCVSDFYGWSAWGKVKRLREWVAKNGRLATWDDFSKLGEANFLKDVLI